MSDSDSEIDLPALLARYRPRLRRDLAELDEKLCSAREGPAAEGALEEAKRLAHRVKGTSGSYGLDEVSASLARIESLLEPLLGGTRSGADEPWGEIERALRWARALAEPRVGQDAG